MGFVASLVPQSSPAASHAASSSIAALRSADFCFFKPGVAAGTAEEEGAGAGAGVSLESAALCLRATAGTKSLLSLEGAGMALMAST
jgi:hypothetical protein